MDQKLAVELHTRAGNLPEAWRSCAEDLLAAAAVLRERRESPPPLAMGDLVGSEWRIHPAELMLKGMAVECLFKALWVKRGHSLVIDGKYVSVPGAGDHDLVQLAGVLQLTLSDFEKDLLRRLSHFIEYGGRYPVPKNAEKLRATATTWSSPSDGRLFDALLLRLGSVLE